MPNCSDNEARNKIDTCLDKNFFVVAGAGSGKTTKLVDRMVKMVESGIPIDKICAITFTKAAANEFYSRFYRQLSKSNSLYSKKALRDIDLCFMGTIDSFCNTIISEHPSEAGIPTDSSIVSDTELEHLYLEKLNQIKKDETSELYSKYKVFRRQFYNADEIYSLGLKLLLEKRNARFQIESTDIENADITFSANKSDLTGLVGMLNNNHKWAYVGNNDSRVGWENLDDSLRILRRRWDGNLPNVKRALENLKKVRVLATEGPQLMGSKFSSLFDFHDSRQDRYKYYLIMPKYLDCIIHTITEYLYSIAMSFILSCIDEISKALKQEGRLTYFDYLLYLRDMLKEDAGNGGRLIRHIQQQYRYYLIDEFQDTNPLQYEIFFYLAAKEPKPNWYECEPMDGALFIVGDPKQSIYRFKNADIFSYNRVKNLFKWDNGEVVNLTENFRSHIELKEWFNTTFVKLLELNEENKGSFFEIPETKKKKSENEDGKLFGTFYYEAESHEDDACKVSEIIKQTIERYDYKYNDFMVITPNKTHLKTYLRQFKQDEIPFFVEGSVIFGQCPSLAASARIISSISKRHEKGGNFEAVNLSQCDVSADQLENTFNECINMSPSAIFTKVVEDFDVFKRVGTENAEYLYYALELIRQSEGQGTLASLEDLSVFLDDLINDGSAYERCLQLVKNTNAVHIANLHKVKGLEAPVVILAGISPFPKTQRPSSRVSYDGDTPNGFIFNINKRSKDSGASFSIPLIETEEFENEKGKEIEAELAERIRLLYVAATRAMDSLIVVKSVRSPAMPAQWEPLTNRIDMNIFKVLDASEPRVKENKEDDKEEEEKIVSKLNIQADMDVFRPSYKTVKPSSITVKNLVDRDTALDDGVVDVEYRGDNDGALKGTMVHRLMEVLVSSKNSVDGSKLVKEIINEYDDSSKREYHESLLKNVLETIRSGGYEQKYGAPKDILKELLSADECLCEVPFSFKDGENLYSGFMDLVYRKNGSWHIIDYKTNADDRDLDKHYKDQLDIYSKAFKHLTGESADACIYHIGM